MGRDATDPDTLGLTAEQYGNIGDQYWQVCRDLDAAIRPVGTTYETLKGRHAAKKARHATAATAPTSAPTSSHHSDTSIFAPVIINEETVEHHHFNVDESPAPEPSTYEAP